MVLALETGGNLASVALLDGMDIAAEQAFRHRMSLSRDLIPTIDALLARAEVGWENVEAVAVGLGPGSFTGLRIGVVTAKALAWGSRPEGGRAVLGIPSLAALAAPHLAPPETLLCAVLEARPGEFFTALYQRREESLQVRAEPTVLPAAELAERLAAYPGPVLVAGHAARFAAAQMPDTHRPPPVGRERLALSFDEEPQARWIGRLAVRRLRAGERDDPAALAPLYVRPPAPTMKEGVGR